MWDWPVTMRAAIRGSRSVEQFLFAALSLYPLEKSSQWHFVRNVFTLATHEVLSGSGPFYIYLW